MLTANFSYTYQWLLSNISSFTMWTQQIIDKISNRSMNNVRILLKGSQKDTRTTFLLLTLKKFHTSFRGLKWWYRSYLCKIFWLKLCSQYLLSCIYYVLFTKIVQRGDTVRLFFTKGVVELVVKILDKYTNRVSKNSFLKLKL